MSNFIFNSIQIKQIEKANQLFQDNDFFEAHEVLEDLWNSIPPGIIRKNVQGLIQICASHHLVNLNKIDGAIKIKNKASKNLELYEQDLEDLLHIQSKLLNLSNILS